MNKVNNTSQNDWQSLSVTNRPGDSINIYKQGTYNLQIKANGSVVTTIPFGGNKTEYYVFRITKTPEEVTIVMKNALGNEIGRCSKKVSFTDDAWKIELTAKDALSPLCMDWIYVE